MSTPVEHPHRHAIAVILTAVVVGIALLAGVVWVASLGAVATGDAAADEDVASAASAPVPVPTSTTAPLASEASPDAAPGPSIVIDPAWVRRQAAAAGIPATALDAYATASVLERARHPSCGIGWNTLAGLGYVESAHGTVHGSRWDRAGTASPAIIGPALDGAAFAAVADTDHGALDGDARWDHAVGPMQFLPAEWTRYAIDANGDGTADPQNIYDESLAAADYLCVAGGDLSSATSWDRAIRAYNPADSYVDRVRDAAVAYGRRSLR